MNEVLSHFYYKYCSIKSTGLVNCTGFLLRVLVLDFSKVLTAYCTVSIKSTGLKNCTGFLLSVLFIDLTNVFLLHLCIDWLVFPFFRALSNLSQDSYLRPGVALYGIL